MVHLAGGCGYNRASLMCRGGGTGRRAGFKIRFLHGSAGSIPALGTTRTKALTTLPRRKPPAKTMNSAFLVHNALDSSSRHP
jgi:hypothetical protein